MRSVLIPSLWLSASVCFQAIPVTKDASQADEAQAAKRRCLPSGSAPSTETSMETATKPASPHTTAPVAAQAASNHSISIPPTSQPAPQDTLAQPQGVAVTPLDAETPMDSSVALAHSLTESSLASDPLLTPQSETPFRATLNSDPLLSAPSPPPPAAQHAAEGYMPSTGYVSYMEALLHSHFPQDDNAGPLY